MTTDERIKTIRDALLPLDDAWDALNSLVAELDAAREAVHYANGVADLAMKHRDAAEARAAKLREALTDLSNRMRPNVEAAPWVVASIAALAEGEDTRG